MSRDETRTAPGTGTARNDQPPAKTAEPPTPTNVASEVALVADLAEYRALRSWADAAAHLNSRGFAAAVPAPLVPRLRKRGLVVWAAASKAAA